MARIIFEAPKGATILTSCLFSTMQFKKIEKDKYLYKTSDKEVSIHLISMHGGKNIEVIQ